MDQCVEKSFESFRLVLDDRLRKAKDKQTKLQAAYQRLADFIPQSSNLPLGLQNEVDSLLRNDMDEELPQQIASGQSFENPFEDMSINETARNHRSLTFKVKPMKASTPTSKRTDEIDRIMDTAVTKRTDYLIYKAKLTEARTIMKILREDLLQAKHYRNVEDFKRIQCEIRTQGVKLRKFKNKLKLTLNVFRDIQKKLDNCGVQLPLEDSFWHNDCKYPGSLSHVNRFNIQEEVALVDQDLVALR